MTVRGVKKLFDVIGNGRQETVAEVLRVSQPSVSRWQSRGWLPEGRAERLGLKYGVNVIDLVRPEVAKLMKGKK